MPKNKFIILHENEKEVKKFNMKGKRITFRITEPPHGVSEFEWAQGAVEDVITYINGWCEPLDQVGFTFSSLDFKETAPGWMKFKPCSELNAEDVWSVVFSLLQSNSKEGIATTQTLRIHVTRVGLPIGTGPHRRKNFYNNFEEECLKRRGIVSITNTDNLCLPRALVVGMAFVKKDPLYKKIRDSNPVQTDKVKALLQETGITIPDEGAGIPELVHFQQNLKELKITVYKYGSKGRDLIFDGVNPNASLKINLLFHEGHYNLITSLTSAFACKMFCEVCRVPYDHKDEHRCKKSCSLCGSSVQCKKDESNVLCPECNREFLNGECFKNHKDKKLCERVKKCLDCLRTYDIKKHKNVHVCGEIYCKNCKAHKPQGHLCYFQVNTQAPPVKDFLFIFFDLETRQEKPLSENPEIKVHEPNLCVLQQCCSECISVEIKEKPICCKCGVRQHVLKDNIVMERFVSHVLNCKKIFKNVCVIAHNGSGFDMQFVLKFIIDDTKLIPDVIMRGAKIILLRLDRVRFVDSLNYLPMALSKLPKAFDLPQESKKGYFPHLFNTIENKSYVGSLPSIEFYGCDNMFAGDREKFLHWHHQLTAENYVFEMEKELEEYCVSDVDILRRAVLKFRDSFLEQCRVDPFLEAVTIASACNLAFRRNFLKPSTIGLIPSGGYRKAENQSKIALQWLVWQESELGLKIHHAGNGREAVLSGIKVDGYCSGTRQIFQFHGCYYHGCTSCFPFRREDSLRDDPSDTMKLRYERTSDRTRHLRNQGYEVIEMWECQFRKLKDEFPSLENHPMVVSAPLDPRDAFYGGRTGCTKLHHRAGVGETIQYVDVCSLYPWVCKYGKYPIGHPEIIVGSEECLKLIGSDEKMNNVDGLIKCTVLPPKNLYHPVLPQKQNDKLMFTLCRTCGEEQNQLGCDHDDEERALSGTWVIDEVQKALRKGYKILRISEIWKYEITQYDPSSMTGGVFTQFINAFLKIKQEASGFPSDCVTDSEKEQYIDSYMKTEGIRLDMPSITSNPGLRSLAKIMLNSFWGRFGMRENMCKTAIVREAHELFTMLANPSTYVNTVHPVNDEVVLVNWEYRDEVEEQSPTVNVVIAAYTTAQARLKLYEHLESLDRQVLYYDTDSVIYSHRENQHKVETGCFLGEMTDELEVYGAGSYITEFVSGGPKTYAYKVFTPGTQAVNFVCKVKGLTLNFTASQIVNFESLKKMIMSGDNEVKSIASHSILRTKDKEVVTAPTSKNFKINILKRRRIEGFETEPYGFQKKEKLEGCESE